ncbi:MAG: hypothetical protein LH632_15195 [Rhodoferax sp.]|nr:hypothetical protein [Rhodoferax sp.]
MNTNHLALVLLLSTVPVSAIAAQSAPLAKVGQARATQAHTPAKGSQERKAITNALRVVAKTMSGLDVVFVVSHLKVNGNWAWVEADPQSVDGTQHYEPMSGLLASKNGRWVYLEGFPEGAICEEDPDCADSERYFQKLGQKYPALSPDIFPRR